MGALCSLIFFYKYSIYCPILILGVRVSYYSFSLNILKTASEIQCPEALKQKRETDKLKRVWRKADNRAGTVEHVMFDVGQLVLSSLRKRELHSGLIACLYLMDTSLRKWSCTLPRVSSERRREIRHHKGNSNYMQKRKSA